MVLGLMCSTLCPFLFCNHLVGEDRVGCFTFIVFSMSHCCYHSSVLSHRTMGYSVVGHWGISW